MSRYKWKKIWNLFQAYLDLLLARDKPKSLPVELSVGTTSFCNLKCVMCPREGSDGNLTPFDEHINLDYFKSLEKYLEQSREVSLYGLGEPMIDKRYFEKVRYVNSFGGEVSLSSNGTLLDEQRCREVIESGIAAIGISVDATCEETFRIVRPPGGFDPIAENIKRLTTMKKEMGADKPLVKVSFGIMKQNLQDVPNFPAFVKEVGGDEIVMHPTIYQSYQAVEDLGLDRNEMLAAVEEARKNAEALGVVFHFWDLNSMTFLNSVDYYRDNRDMIEDVRAQENQSNGEAEDYSPPQNPKYYCHFLWRNAMVQGKGEVFPCCYMSNIKLGKFENGNLNELRSHPILTKMRRDLYEGNPPGPCQSCPQMLPYDRTQILKDGYHEIKHMIKHS